MIVKRLQFDGFRNLHKGEIYPHSGVNVIFGTNAQGKTNLLEAIWLLSGNKSFRGSRESELINFNSEYAALRIDFFSEERDQNAELLLRRGKKDVKLNGVKKTSSAALIGKLCVVVFSPEHLSLVKSGPAQRRRFIDSAVCQIKPAYGETLAEYKKTLAQRNALLKDIPLHSELLDTLEIWDYRLAVLGASIIRMRINYIEKLSERASQYHLGISNGTEKLDIKYICSVPRELCDTGISVRDVLSEKISLARADDIKDRVTSIGPHRDDIEILINGENARIYGSQGQQRSCVLSMKISEAELLKMACEQEPVILLDDVLSELDAKRQEYLLNKISDRQVFITCCEAASVERLKIGKLFEVKNGIVLGNNEIINTAVRK